MQIVNIHEAKTNFSKLINAALHGKDIVIAKGGKPIIKLIPYQEQIEPRKSGQLSGMIKINADFDEPLPTEILNKFYNSDD